MAVKVLIVDDSAVIRQALTKELALDPEISVIGSAPDPYIARDKIIKEKPDVITLDIEMPRMDGISFLKKIMQFHPIPVIILSSLAKSGSQTAIDALNAGAVDVLCKPGFAYSLGDMSVQLREKIKEAVSVDLNKLKSQVKQVGETIKPLQALSQTTEKVIVIGASTGGVQAIERVVRELPLNCPGVVIVQHMPPGFTKNFSDRLNGICQVEVKEAENGDKILPSRVLIAPGSMHMVIKRSGAQYYVEVKDGPLVNRHKPSVDVLFNSAATTLGANAIGVMLTGMGDDGARAMLKMKDAGAHTICQSEKTCVVYGMPRAAVELGAAKEVLDLDKIASAVISQVKKM